MYTLLFLVPPPHPQLLFLYSCYDMTTLVYFLMLSEAATSSLNVADKISNYSLRWVSLSSHQYLHGHIEIH